MPLDLDKDKHPGVDEGDFINPSNDSNPTPPAEPPVDPPVDPPAPPPVDSPKELYNKLGDLVDTEGNIIKTKSELELENPPQPTDDEDTYYNSNGDLVDASGTVIKTKSELDAEADTSTFIESYQKQLGYTFEDENGNPIQFEDTIEGLQKYNEMVIAKKEQELVEKIKSSRPSIVNDFENYVIEHGTYEGFFNDPFSNLDNLTVTEENTDLQKQVLTRYFKAKGFSDEKAAKQVTLIEAADELYAESKDALVELKSIKQKNDAKIAEQRAVAQAQQEENYQKTLQEVKNMITQGKVADITIPQADRNAFYEYLTKPVKEVNGTKVTQHVLDMQQEDLTKDILFAFYRYKKYDITNLVTDKVNAHKARTITDKLRRNTTQTPASRKDQSIRSSDIIATIDKSKPFS